MNSATINKVNTPPCQSAEWCPQCSFSFHCHEQRTGQINRVRWPAVVLGMLVGLGIVLHFVG